MAAVASFCTSSLLPYFGMLIPLRHIEPRKLIRLGYKSGRKRVNSLAGAPPRKLVIFAVTEGSAKSNKSDEKIPSWAKPDSDEPPPWAREEGSGSTGKPAFAIPFYVFLLASAVTAIAAVGSIFEYINQRPVFGILNSDSVFYAPVLGFFVITGIPSAAFLWFRSVQVANKEAEEQDRRDGYL